MGITANVVTFQTYYRKVV